MVKRALCVGINDYPYAGSDLNGCVNDARSWAELLMNQYDFPNPDIKIITDSKATKTNVMSALKDLFIGIKKGDVIVFTNSSHGSYMADTSGDEEKYDEVICPYDTDTNVIVDDELRELFQNLPDGVRFTVISDSCFSGTVTRPALGENLPGYLVPDDRRIRFLNPALRRSPVLVNPWKAKCKRKSQFPESSMKEILISGCSDKEYSYDIFIDGGYHGAMTYYAQKIIKEARYKITYNQLGARLSFKLEDEGYPQHPQVEGKMPNKKMQVFT